MPKASNYVLKNGVLFHPQGTSEFYVNGTITDEVAETELAKNPEFISKFSKYPTDYQERVKARAAGNAFDEEDSVAALKKKVALLKGQLAEKEAQITAKDATIATMDAEIAALKSASSMPTETQPVTEAKNAKEEEAQEASSETDAAKVVTPKARKTATKK